MNSNSTSNLRFGISMAVIIAMLIMLIVANLLIGSVDIEPLAVWQIVTGRGHENHVWEIIILNTRLPMIATAALSGAALSVSGLLLQTAFNNPLAGPSILGVSTGASFGVAVVMLASGSALWLTQSVGTYMTILIGALVGAALVLIVLLLFSTMVHSSTMLLIIGILVSYLTSSAVSLLNFFATEEGVHSYVIWGLGNFSGVTPSQLPFFAFFII